MSTPAETMATTLAEIDALAERYAAAFFTAGDVAEAMEQDVAAVRAKHGPTLRRLVADAAALQAQLEAAVAAHPELFVKPKTRIVARIKFGLRKLKGKVDLPDEARTIERIREQLPRQQALLLIRTREEVDRNALADLTVADLKRIGASVVDDTDAAFAKPVVPDVAKLIAAAARALGDGE